MACCDCSIEQLLLQMLVCATIVAVTYFAFKPHMIVPALMNTAMMLIPGVKKRNVVLSDGTVCSYLELGSAASSNESVVYLHGFTESIGSYLTYMPFLLRWKHMIFLNLLNHGDTGYLQRDVEMEDMMKYLNLFVHHTGLHARKFHIAGYSLGGCVAINYTSRHPERIASLFLLNPYGLYAWENGGNLDALKHFGHLTNDISFENVDALKKFLDFASNGSLPIPRPVLTLARYHRNDMSAKEGSVLRGILGKNQLIEKCVLDKLSKIPVMCLQGDEDRICPKEGLEYLQQHVPHAKRHIIADGSHLMTYSHVRTVASQLKLWVESDDARKVVDGDECGKHAPE